jgi:hypothetical protein
MAGAIYNLTTEVNDTDQILVYSRKDGFTWVRNGNWWSGYFPTVVQAEQESIKAGNDPVMVYYVD